MVIENAANDNIDRDTLCEYTLSFLLAVYFNYLEFYNKEDSILLVKNSKRLKELYDIYHYENKADEDRVYADKASFYFYDKNKTFVIKPVITFEEFLELYNQF